MTDENRAVVLGDGAPGNSDEADEPNQAASEHGSMDDGNEQESTDQVQNETSDTYGLSEDELAFAKSKGINGPEDFGKALKSYKELEKLHSSTDLSLKSDNPTDDEWADFRKRSNAPESKDAYVLEQPEDMPEHVYYDNDLLEQAREAALDVGMKPQQFQKFAGQIQDSMINQQVAAHEHQQNKIGEAGEAINKEWQNDVVLTDNVDIAFRSMKSVPGLLDAYVSGGLMVPVPGQDGKYMPTNPDIVFYHAEIGQKLLKEPGGFEGAAGAVSGQNPFKDGGNETHQAAIIREDPAKAKALIRQAGGDVNDYF